MQKGLPNLPEGKGLVLFDGYCNLCNGAVQFIIKRDPKEHFRFSSLSWPPAKSLLQKNPEFGEVDSILLFENGELFQKSTAALKIAGKLGGLWPVLKIFFVVPRFLRDPIYDFIARNRYKWFGKKDICMMPDKKVDHLFLGGRSS
ncbi:MAG: putative DCC family thiol-disulfide oxidoreductase YuxK [Cryomorphaceae bacterium]|jgi:predicted DCC family thiol-disulfide oxidoreductase YuxK